MSNNGLPNRKFSQTFFLAEQINGYYVLNDIFRYLKDDDDIEEGDEYEHVEEVMAEVEEAVAVATDEIIDEIQEMGIKGSSSVEIETAGGDKIKVEETVELEPAAAAEPEPTVEETPAPINGSEEATNGTEEAAPAPEEEKKAEEAEEAQEAEEAEPEAPAEERAPTPVIEEKPMKATPPPPPAPVVPSPPKTWAKLVAGGPKPAIPATRPAAASAPSVPPVTAAPVQTSAPAAAAAAAPSAPAAPATPVTPTTPSGGSQWQTADNKRHSRINANAGAAATGGQTQAYIKNVTDEEALRKTLTKYGNVKIDMNKPKVLFLEQL